MAMEEWEGGGGARENSVASFRQKADVPADVKTAFLKRQEGFWVRLVASFCWKANETLGGGRMEGEEVCCANGVRVRRLKIARNGR
jgi:hypothetical protein